MRHILFYLQQEQASQPTAESVFAAPDIETDSAGLAPDADCVLTAEQLVWADMIFVMEKQHRATLQQRFPACLKGKKVVCLDVPDRFGFMQPELVKLLCQKVRQHLHQDNAGRIGRG